MTKKARILEILSRKEAATPVGDALLNAAKKTEAFARSREGVSSIAGGIGGGLLGALLSKGSRKKRLRNILLGMGIGGAGGYAAGRYMPPLTGAGKEEYDPVADGANPTITGQQEPAKDNSSREEKAAPKKAPALTERQEAQQAAQQKKLDLLKEKFSPEAQRAYSRQPTLAGIIEYNRVRGEKAAQQKKLDLLKEKFSPEAQRAYSRRPTFFDPIDFRRPTFFDPIDHNKKRNIIDF